MQIPSDSRRELWQCRLQPVLAAARRIVPFTAGVAAALLALWFYNFLSPPPQPLTERQVKEAVAQAMASATPAPPFSTRAWQVVQPSLVLIQTEGKPSEDHSSNALGSGVLISENGDILTSLHVVDGASRIKVTFADGTEAGALITASQPENDIALLAVDTLPGVLIPAILGNPNALHVGDEVYAAGSPFGLYGSFSSGVVSGFNRSFRSTESGVRIEGLIQVDAAVNPGNSGGPLINRYGQVVGIVVGILNPTGQDVFIGIGFAVPIDVAGGAAGLPPY